MTITVLPATADRFDDVEHAITGGGDGASCQCQWWTIRNADYNASTPDERAELLREQVAAPVAPGLIAYVDNEAVGWVRVGPRAAQLRIPRTKEIVATTEEPMDAGDVWSISCFAVRREHRGQGVMGALLGAAVAHARAHGARVIEAYPLDPAVTKKPSNLLFRGTVSTFLAAGFREVARAKPDRALVSLAIG